MPIGRPPSLVFRARALIVAMAIFIGVAVWGAGALQQHANRDSTAHLANADAMSSAVAAEESAVRQFVVQGDDDVLRPVSRARRDYAAALRQARADAHTEQARDALTKADRLVRAWRRAALASIEYRRRTGEASMSQATRRLGLYGEYRAAHRAVLEAFVTQGESRADSASRWAVIAAVVIAIAAAIFGEFGLVRRSARSLRDRASQATFASQLLGVRNRAEAGDMLRKRILEAVPGARVDVLRIPLGTQRLEPTLPVEDPAIAVALRDATAASCLSIRLGSTYTRTEGETAADPCPICGLASRAITCRPLQVGDDPVGAVLVQHQGRLDDRATATVRDSADLAAAVLANLRQLAAARELATTDPLTGVANRRSVEGELERMLSHARRAEEPLAAIMLDVDNFKALNDHFGHDAGDGALLQIATALGSDVRASDVVGRIGGEEFVVLCPATSAAGATILAEKLRTSIEAVDGPHSLTASFGVAVYPYNAHDAAELLRAADKALYTAKANGRNRVELADLAPAEEH